MFTNLIIIIGNSDANVHTHTLAHTHSIYNSKLSLARVSLSLRFTFDAFVCRSRRTFYWQMRIVRYVQARRWTTNNNKEEKKISRTTLAFGHYQNKYSPAVVDARNTYSGHRTRARGTHVNTKYIECVYRQAQAHMTNMDGRHATVVRLCETTTSFVR